MKFLIAALLAVVSLFQPIVARSTAVLRTLSAHPLAVPAATCAVFVAMAVFYPALTMAAPFAIGALLTEGTRAGYFLLSEDNGKRSRDTVTVTVGAGATLVAGLVLGKITATGKYVAYNDAAGDGSQVAAAILYAEQKNSTGGAVDVKAVVINADAEVRSAALNWNGQAAGAITNGTADLLALGIKLRD